MLKTCIVALAAGMVLAAAGFQQSSSEALDGRWDLTLKAASGQTYPSWVEVRGARDNPQVRLVGRGGSVHPGQNVKVDGSTLTFQTTEGNWTLASGDGGLKGTLVHNQAQADVSGVRAPRLDRPMPSKWGKPSPIFNGKNLNGWIADHPDKNHWKVEDGALVNESAGANIRSERQFNDFKLHIEYNCPEDGNSGVYLRGRYEVQVEYVKEPEDNLHSMGSIYGFIGPSQQLPKKPGQWESFDITLVGRTVTVVRDGVTTISSQEIPGITGGALNSHEGEPGPIYLQGDHTGGMKYRNITISVPE
jgi:hypothetical protein